MSNLSLLMEAYAGKSKELVKCEGYLRDIIKQVKAAWANYKDFKSTSVYRQYKSCEALENTLTKFFNVKQIRIYWTHNDINARSLTPTSISCFYRKKTDKYANLKIHIEIDEMLITFCNLNERELLAVILHEIGHNFYYNPMLIVRELLTVVFMPYMLIVRWGISGAYKVLDEIRNSVKKNIPFLSNLIGTYHNLDTQIKELFREYDLIDSFVAMFKRIVSSGGNPIVLLSNSVAGYGAERGADSFATKYGYGPELVTGLKKIRNPSNTIGHNMRKKMGKFGEVSNDLYSVTFDLYNMFTFNEHPNANQRASSMLKKLERDLKTNDYPPEVKADLEDEIKRMKKMYQTINDNEGNTTIRKGWYEALDAITNGHSDIREIFNGLFAHYEF